MNAQVAKWLHDYVAMMDADVKKHANPVGLHRAVVNRKLKERIAEVRVYLEQQVLP